MDKNYKITLQYDGARYDGWQKQGNTDNTIQGKIETVLKVLAGREVEVFGSGRTDEGVHAIEQVANFHLDLEEEMGPEKVKHYLNQYLPDDIAVLDAVIVPIRFHSRYHAIEKTYLYQIDTSDKKYVFERKYVYGLGMKLDVCKMRLAADQLMGSHDFKSFCGNRKMKKSTVRNLTNIAIETQGSKVLIRYTGDGFLQQMVRIMTGTLIEVGLGKRDYKSMPQVLRAADRQEAGYTVPAQGLFLEHVKYQ